MFGAALSSVQLALFSAPVAAELDVTSLQPAATFDVPVASGATEEAGYCGDEPHLTLTLSP